MKRDGALVRRAAERPKNGMEEMSHALTREIGG